MKLTEATSSWKYQANPEPAGRSMVSRDTANGLWRQSLRLWAGGEDLRGHPKGDGRQVRIAVRLRRETTLSLAWIAGRLAMGAAGHVACLRYRHSRVTQASENSENNLFFLYVLKLDSEAYLRDKPNALN